MTLSKQVDTSGLLSKATANRLNETTDIPFISLRTCDISSDAMQFVAWILNLGQVVINSCETCLDLIQASPPTVLNESA